MVQGWNINEKITKYNKKKFSTNIVNLNFKLTSFISTMRVSQNFCNILVCTRFQ